MASGTVQLPNFTWYTILAKTTLSTNDTYATKSTFASRKITDYDVLLFEFFRNQWIVGSAVVPTSDFTGNTGVSVSCRWENELIEFDAKYTTDTSFDVKKDTTSTATIAIKIMGLKAA